MGRCYNWSERMVGNPNIRSIIKTGPTTELGKFKVSLNALKDGKRSRIPAEAMEVFNFWKSLDKKQINELIELKNFSIILKEITIPAIIEKVTLNEQLTKKELDTLRLWKETIVDLHKLKYGDKKVIEHQVTVADIRRQMMSDKKIIDAEVLSNDPIRQSDDNSGSGEDGPGQDGSDTGDNKIIEEKQESSEHNES